MSRKTHPHKRTHAKRNLKQKPGRVSPRRYDWRTKVLAGAIAFVLLAGGALAHWRAKPDEVLVARNIPPTPVKNISTASASDLADIPPEALRPQPPMAAGYNAHSGGLPPGALPPGVVLPGMPMMQGGRTTAQGYGVYDGIRQQFTGKERDNETGLDYFGARYYSPAQGRFTSVDPKNASADPADPQSWNGYAYARNNPLKYVDPDGRKYRLCAPGGCTDYDDKDVDEWRKQDGVRFKGGKIFDKEGHQIGTYRRLSDDNWSDAQNRLFFGELPRRLAPIQQGADEVGRRAKNMGKALVGTFGMTGADAVNGAGISPTQGGDPTGLIMGGSGLPPTEIIT